MPGRRAAGLRWPCPDEQGGKPMATVNSALSAGGEAAGRDSTADRSPQAYWNPYLAGLGLGLVLLAAFVIMGRGLGASGAFSTLVAASIQAVAPEHARHNEFYAEYLGGGANPLKDWLLFEVIGVF